MSAQNEPYPFKKARAPAEFYFAHIHRATVAGCVAALIPVPTASVSPDTDTEAPERRRHAGPWGSTLRFAVFGAMRSRQPRRASAARC